jgi:hypothetical protein
MVGSPKIVSGPDEDLNLYMTGFHGDSNYNTQFLSIQANLIVKGVL